VKPAPVETVPLLVTGTLTVTGVPAVAEVGDTAPTVRFAPVAADTFTEVHAEQLSFSLISMIEPTKDALLSAHTRTYQVPPVGNVRETEATVLFPAASVVAVCVCTLVTELWSASASNWKRLVNPAPVEAVPLLLIVADMVTATPAVAVVGVGAPEVRCGPVGGDVTVTAVQAEQLSFSFVSLIAPMLAAEDLSAQARTYFTPGVTKV
jgi:hypothetical protein